MKNRTPLLAAAILILLFPLSRVEAKLPESLRYSEDGILLLQGDQAASGLYDPTVLRTFELTFGQSDWWEQLTANYESEVEIPADLTVDGEVYPGVGVRFKGMTSYQMTGNSRKKSFNISLDFQDPDQRLMGYKTLNLNNAASDPTFLREALYFDAARRYVPCPRVSFVRLFINGESWGLYVHVEQLNAEMIEEWFDDPLGTRWKVPFAGGDQGTGRISSSLADSVITIVPGGTGGFVPMDTTRIGRPDTLAPGRRDSLRPGGTDTPRVPGQGTGGIQPGGGGGTGGLMGSGNGALVWLGVDSTAYLSAYEVKSSHVENPWPPLITACNLVNNAPLADLADTLESALAVDRWLWFLAVENVFTDEDSYLTKGADYQIYAEPGASRLHPLQYDGNESFVARDANLSPFEGETSTQRPLLSRVLAVPALRQRFLAHYRTILTESFDWAVLGPKVTTYRALIEAEVQADPKKLDTYEEFQTGLTALESLVTARRTWLLSRADVAAQAPQIAAVALPTAVAAAKASLGTPTGESVRVTATIDGSIPAAEVRVYYAAGLDGRFAWIAMADDGAHGDGAGGDGCFGAEIPAFPTGALVRWYVEARAADGSASYLPAGAEHDTYVFQVTAARSATTPVVINEVMAANDTRVQDPQGEYEDWIEVRSLASTAVDLSGMYLSDSEADPRKWAFPEGTVLPAGGYLVVWADGDEEAESGLHAGFKLSADGETVCLVDTDARGNALLDSVVFGEQEADRALGRVPDGTGPFQVLTEPTPGGTNAAITAVLEPTGTTPTRFALEPNYPNPFNGGTVIRFSLPALTDGTELVIYNLAGQRLVRLDLSACSAGEYQWSWDGRDQEGRTLASGVYLMRLSAGGPVEARRLALVR